MKMCSKFCDNLCKCHNSLSNSRHSLSGIDEEYDDDDEFIHYKKFKKSVRFSEEVHVYLIPSRRDMVALYKWKSFQRVAPYDGANTNRSSKLTKSKYFPHFKDIQSTSSSLDIPVKISDIWYALDDIKFFKIKVALKYEHKKQRMTRRISMMTESEWLNEKR